MIIVQVASGDRTCQKLLQNSDRQDRVSSSHCQSGRHGFPVCRHPCSGSHSSWPLQKSPSSTHWPAPGGGHPVAGSHVLLLQTSPSEQTTGVCVQTPVAGSQVSTVQAFPSSGSGVWTHPFSGVQTSAVSVFPSSQAALSRRWSHPPSECASQTSTVHAMPSSQRLLSTVWEHVSCVTSHTSVVQTSPSSHPGTPGRQPPVGLHVSAPLHPTPSSHRALSATWA